MLTKRAFDKSSTNHDLFDKFQWHSIFLSNSRLETQGLCQKAMAAAEPWPTLFQAFVEMLKASCFKLQQMMLTPSLVKRSWLDPTLGWVWHNWRHEQRPGCRSLTEVRPYLLCLQCRWPQSTTQNSIQSCFLLQVSFLALRRLLSFMFWHLDSFCTGCTPMVPQNYFKLVWMLR